MTKGFKYGPLISNSKLEFINNDFAVDVTIRSRKPLVYRRQIARQIFSAIDVSIKRQSILFVTHSDAKGPISLLRDSERGVFVNSACREPDGLRYRLRRLERKMTLRQLSAECGLSIARLSLVERGLCLARYSTRLKIEMVLYPHFEVPLSNNSKR